VAEDLAEPLFLARGEAVDSSVCLVEPAVDLGELRAEELDQLSTLAIRHPNSSGTRRALP
jgi:hypothetical protein